MYIKAQATEINAWDMILVPLIPSNGNPNDPGTVCRRVKVDNTIPTWIFWAIVGEMFQNTQFNALWALIGDEGIGSRDEPWEVREFEQAGEWITWWRLFFKKLD
jgi:hypothetical protein